MINILKTFFYPTSTIYAYCLPKEHIVKIITSEIENTGSYFNKKDFWGRFVNYNTFKLKMVPYAFTSGLKLSASLFGTIQETEGGVTKIIIKSKPSYSSYIFFLISIVLFFNFSFCFISSGALKFLFFSILVFFVGMVLSIGYTNVSVYAINYRYKTYIHELLQRATNSVAT